MVLLNCDEKTGFLVEAHQHRLWQRCIVVPTHLQRKDKQEQDPTTHTCSSMPPRLHTLLCYSSGRLKAVCLPVFKPQENLQESAVFSVYFTQQNGVTVRPQTCIRKVPTSNHSRKTRLSWLKFSCNPSPQPQLRTCHRRIAFSNDRYLPNHLQQRFYCSMLYGVKQNSHTNSSQRFLTIKTRNCYTT